MCVRGRMAGQRPPWHNWYKTARWERLRQSTFRRDLYTCQCGCGQIEGKTSLLVCDHIKPHRGDEQLFWDPDNLQTMRKVCHDTIKRREEQSTNHKQGVWY